MTVIFWKISQVHSHMLQLKKEMCPILLKLCEKESIEWGAKPLTPRCY